MKHLSVIAALAVSAISVACTIVDCDDPNTNSALCYGPSGTTGEDEEAVMCPRHCWERGSQLSYPMAAGPLNAQFVSIPSIQNRCWDGAGYIDLTGPFNSIQSTYCPPQQSQSEAVQAVIDDDATQPQQTVYENVADGIAAAAWADCVEIMLAEGCIEDQTQPGQFGANQVCEWWLENPLRQQLYNESPTPFYAGRQSFSEPPNTVCDFDDDLQHDAGLDESGGGGGNVFGDLSVVSCTGCDCNYPPALKDSTSAMVGQLFTDGVRLEQFHTSGIERYRLTIPPNTDSEELFNAFGLYDGDEIHKINGVEVKSNNLTLLLEELDEDDFDLVIKRSSWRSPGDCDINQTSNP